MSIGAYAIVGPNMFSTALYRFDTFTGIGLFSAFIAYGRFL